MTFNVDDYVDVAERLRLFYEKYPDGRITRLNDPHIMQVGERVFIVYDALAYRTPDDPKPCVGTAWEPFPGPTQFTRDSELMNAETAAWGRAIVAAGIPSKKVATSDEVKARQSGPQSGADGKPSPKQLNYLKRILDGNAANVAKPTLQTIMEWAEPAGVKVEAGWVEKLTRRECSGLIDRLTKEGPPDVPSDGFDPPAPSDETDVPWEAS